MAKSTELTMRADRPRIKVTQSDIDRAFRSDSYHCVVAQAIARALPDATRIDVDTQTVRFTREGRRWAYLTPYAVQGYVIAFDAGDTIEPFEFTLTKNIAVARKATTPPGRKLGAARDTVARAARKANTTAAASLERPAQDQPTPELASARAAYDAARTEAAGERLTSSDKAGPRPPKRVFKTKQRSYGHRVLRINQPPAE